MGRRVAGDMPELDRLVEESCAEIGREIEALRIPRLAGVVLGGGYGRGEGGSSGGGLSNDLDFFAVTERGAPEAETLASIGEAIRPVSEKWTAKLGVDVDFAVKTPWRLKHDEERIMVQELVRGYLDVAGEKGETLFAEIDRRPAEALPWMEAARLLMNRGMGLLFAMSGGEGRDFVNRNINKCILGAGDARLVSRRAYAWRAEDRAKALGDALYDAAIGWKFRPCDEPVCGWEKARETWLDAFRDISREAGAEGRSRNLRNAARWIVRRRSFGDVRTFALDPVVRVLESVARHVRERRAPEASLLSDWKVFN